MAGKIKCPKCKKKTTKGGGEIIEQEDKSRYNICDNCEFRWQRTEEKDKINIII